MINVERQRGETKYGGVRHGSGRFMTPQIWRLLESPIGELNWSRIAYRLAWSNGCDRPEENIQKRGAEINAKGDGRNNFLFGLIKSSAKQCVDKRLYNQLTYGWEKVPEGRKFEYDHVPVSYSEKRIRRGFACDNAYDVTTTFWKEFEEKRKAEGSDPSAILVTLLDAMDEAIVGSTSSVALRQNFLQRSAQMFAIPLIKGR